MASKCSMCNFVVGNAETILQHVVRKHKDNPGFLVQCVFEGCGVTYNKWKSFEKHILRKHGGAIPPENVAENVIDDQHFQLDEAQQPQVDEAQLLQINEAQPMQIEEGNIQPSREQLKLWTAGSFLLTMREEANISQKALNLVVDKVETLMMSRISDIQAELMEKQIDGSIPSESVNAVMNAAKSEPLFAGVNSQHLLDKFALSCGGIAPKAIFLGNTNVWDPKTAQIVEKKSVVYTVPLIECLTQLLSHHEILNYVENPPVNEGDVLKDLRDGSWFKEHPLFSVDPRALIIIFYYDDLTTSNALGTKRRKYSMFYWVLGNIPPHLRSSLRAVNLYAIAPSSYLKRFGAAKILESFMNDVKKLESEGVTFVLNGHEKKFRGALFLTTADTPAAQFLAGFKESISKALSPCRTCKATSDLIQEMFLESDFVLRDKNSHEQDVAAVTDPTLTPEERKEISKNLGVVSKSAFSELNYFDVTKCFVHDLMHVCLEGILPMEIRLFLQYVVKEEKLISLKDINRLILSFNYGHLQTDRPAVIDAAHLDNSLRQTSMECLALGHVIPFIIRPYIESNSDAMDRLHCLINLVQIINLCLSYEFTEDDIATLEHLILRHHFTFKVLYPNVRLTPKFHYLVHLPRQIVMFGPLRFQWCLRFEATHLYFKRLMTIAVNYKNAPLTMSKRFCSKRTSLLLHKPGQQGNNFLDLGDKVLKGSTVLVGNHAHSDLLKLVIPELCNRDYVMNSKQVESYGSRYCKNSIILVRNDSDDLPRFGKVTSICVFGQKKYWCISRNEQCVLKDH